MRSKRSLQVDGRDARSYVIDFDGKTEEITFVLDDRREYGAAAVHFLSFT